MGNEPLRKGVSSLELDEHRSNGQGATRRSLPWHSWTPGPALTSGASSDFQGFAVQHDVRLKIWLKSAADLAQLGSGLLVIANIVPKSGQFRQTAVKSGTKLANAGPNHLANHGQTLAKIVRNWAEIAQMWSIPANICPTLAEFGRPRSKSRRVDRTQAYFGKILVKSDRSDEVQNNFALEMATPITTTYCISKVSARASSNTTL